jgi:hypothetical protein
MVTCFIKYIIDPNQVSEFELYGKKWIDLVNEMGGIHHGYLLPFEGSNNVGYASFSYPSLAAYEEYRIALSKSEKCQEVLRNADDKKFIISYERSFMKPVFGGLKSKDV